MGLPWWGHDLGRRCAWKILQGLFGRMIRSVLRAEVRWLLRPYRGVAGPVVLRSPWLRPRHRRSTPGLTQAPSMPHALLPGSAYWKRRLTATQAVAERLG